MERVKGIIHTNEKWLKKGVIFDSAGDSIDLNDLDSFWPSTDAIAMALSRTCRFRGVTAYTVAQHCVRGADAFLVMGDVEKAYQFLYHDSVEYVVGDVPGPVIKMMPEIDDLQNKILERLSNVFHFKFPFDPEVITMDNNLAEIEMSTYIHAPEEFAHSIWSQQEAYLRFLEMDRTLQKMYNLQQHIPTKETV